MDVPARLRSRPLFRGLPIPYTTFIAPDGTPDFKITNLIAWMECTRKKLCSVCGQDLDYWVWYIGSPDQVKDQIFFDPAMHEECARYAADVCPFIAYRTGYAQNVKEPEGGKILAHAAADFEINPGEMCLSKHRRDKLEVGMHGQRHFIAVQAPVEVEEIPRKQRPAGESGQ
jgi:hypothetical protein